MECYNYIYKLIYFVFFMAKNEKRIKIAVIAGASSALKYKERNPKATEQEILQHVTSEANLILSRIDDEL